MDKPNYYAIIPASVRYDKDLSPTAKLFFGEITSLANATGICFAGNDYFSKIYNISERQVKRIIKQLEEKEYIYVTRNTQSREIQLAERVTKMSPIIIQVLIINIIIYIHLNLKSGTVSIRISLTRNRHIKIIPNVVKSTRTSS